MFTSLAWAADGKGFYYARPERPAEERYFFQRIYFHQLGTAPAQDSLVAGSDFPRVAAIALSQNHRVVVASVANGTGGEFAHYLIGQAARLPRSPGLRTR